MSVFSCEYGHTLLTGLSDFQSWEKYWDLEKSHDTPDDTRAKIPQKLNHELKKIQILGENGINSKLKQRKAHNSFL